MSCRDAQPTNDMTTRLRAYTPRRFSVSGRPFFDSCSVLFLPAQLCVSLGLRGLMFRGRKVRGGRFLLEGTVKPTLS